MLHPFRATLLSVTDPIVTRAEAARWSRSIRDSGGADLAVPGAPPGAYRHTREALLYGYTVTSPLGVVFSGLVGAVRLLDLLPHEDTLRAWGMKPSPPVEIRPLLAVATRSLPALEPVGPKVSATYGALVHHVTPVRSPRGAVATGTLVLADGHHRRAAALRDLGPEATAMVLVVGDGGAGLRAESFQRRLPGVGPLPGDVGETFIVSRLDRVVPRTGGLVWVDHEGTGYLLRARSEAVETLPPSLRGIGAAVAQRLLYPRLGITDDDAEIFSTSIGARHSLQPGDAALLLPRVGIPDVIAAAEAGTMLPPKGSRFRPKPLRGLVIRDQPAVTPRWAITRS